MPEKSNISNDIFTCTCSLFITLGAGACVQLNQLEEAVTWCDEGLAVSFIIVIIVMFISQTWSRHRYNGIR